MPEQHDGTPKSDSDRLVRIETLVEGLASDDADQKGQLQSHDSRLQALEKVATHMGALVDIFGKELPVIKERLSRNEKLTYIGLGMAILIGVVLVPIAASIIGR